MTAERILVTDADTRGSLAMTRGLHCEGFRVTAAASARARPAAAHWSRSVHERVVIPSPLDDVSGFVQALEAVVRRGDYSALVAGSDEALLTIARTRHRLEPHLRSGLPAPESVTRALDKRALIAVASRHGLDAPCTISCRGLAEVRSAAERLGFPLILKPLSSVSEVCGSLRRVGATFVRDGQSLEATAAAYGGACLVQRREHGPVLSFAGVFAEGRLLGQALSRYHRTWRPEAGGASFAETVQSPPWLAERVKGLVSEIGWEGLFELELIKRADGRYAAIDLNPRPYGSLALAIAAGANLPAIWCSHVLGRESHGGLARAGVFYRWEDADLSHALWQARRRHFVASARVLRLRRRVVHSHFRSRDPGPLVARSLLLVKTRWLRGRCNQGSEPLEPRRRIGLEAATR